MAYDFSKGSKTIRKVGFLDGVSGSKIRPVSPFPLESSKGLVAKYFDSTKESLSATRLLDQSPLNSGTRRTGEEGRCYLYDGVNDYSTLDAGFTASGDFTLSFNINATSFASPFHVFIASTTSDRIYFNNGISFNIIANGTLSIFTLDKTLVAGAWYNILVRRVSGTITVYVDGVAQSDTEANAQDLDFLYLSSSTIGLNANIFDVRYFNSAITDPQLNYVVSFGRTGTPVTPTNWWKCDEQSGTVGYDSVGGNHLTHTNITAATFHSTQNVWSFQNQVGYNTSGAVYIPRDESDPTNDVLGNPLTNTGRRPNDAALHSSNCLTLNGTNQAVRIADNTALDITDNLTVCVWAKNNNALLSATNAVFSKYDFGNNKREWALQLNLYEELDLAFGDPNDGTLESISTVASGFSIDSWRHYAFTFEAGTVKIYIDGVSKSFTNSAAPPLSLYSNNSDLIIGGANNNGASTSFFDGQIFDARIYAGDSTVLTAAQIQSIYSDGTNNIQFAGQSLRAHYKLAEGGGTQCLDASGNENHGTIENAATNWSVTQDLVHSNLSDGFVYAYQPAKQVFTGAQAANIKEIRFKFRSADSALVIFNDGSYTPWLLVIENGSTSTLIFSDVGSPVILIDGSSQWGTTRDDLHNVLCDGDIHQITISDIKFVGDWSNGIHINKFNTLYWDTSTYLWDLQAFDSDGNEIVPVAPDVRLPAVTSSLGPYSMPLTDLPSNSYRNRAETLIDLDPDSTPEMSNIYLESVFNGSTSNGYVTNDSVLNFIDNLTVSCWAKSDLTDITSSADTLVSMYEDTGDLEVWRMEISTDEKLRFQVGNSGGTGATIETADSAYPIDTWTHYAATFDGGVVKLYVNGELQSSSESSAHATSLNGRSSPLVLGAYYWSGGGGSFQEWDGALRNIRVYKGDSAPLSNSQIVRDMMETASQPRFEGQTVIASYDLVKDTLDRSGNSLNAQNNNISFTKKTVPASLDLGTDLGEDGIVQKTVKFDSGEWGAVFDGSSYMIVKNREKLKIKEKPFSIECSVKTSDTGSNTILSKYQTSGNLRSYSLNIESGKIVFHSSSNGTAVVSSTGSDTINDGSWHKIKVVRESESGTSLKMYVDDVEDTGVGGSLASNFSDNISNVAIGAYNTDATSAYVFTGNLRDLRVKTNDVEVAHWELAKDTRDSSPNNYHGTNDGVTFLKPKREHSITVSDRYPLGKPAQFLKQYNKSKLYL